MYRTNRPKVIGRNVVSKSKEEDTSIAEVRCVCSGRCSLTGLYLLTLFYAFTVTNSLLLPLRRIPHVRLLLLLSVLGSWTNSLR